MGNYLSCTLSSGTGGGGRPKVILPDGKVLRLDPVTAAEIMLEHPGHFLVNASAMLVSRRLFALSADELLDFGVVYAMFTMNRIGSVVTTADMGRLLLAAGGKETRRSVGAGRRSQVIPDDCVVTVPIETTRETSWNIETTVLDDGLMARFRYSKSLGRSKRPALETITEGAVMVSRKP